MGRLCMQGLLILGLVAGSLIAGCGGGGGGSSGGDGDGVIPTGCFDMGDVAGVVLPDELPVHNVCITGFTMDTHEVTNAQYKACVDAGQCSAPSSSASSTRLSYYGNPAFDDYPVVNVSWDQADQFCAWQGKRLPTEAEWEYAARGGLSGKRYPWGDTITVTDANYDDNGNPWDGDTSPVGEFAPNGYGLHDVAGNVLEWTGDWYASGYYAVSPSDDPQGPGTGSFRVARGGSWNYDASWLRVSDRFGEFLPTVQTDFIGFRCAQD